MAGRTFTPINVISKRTLFRYSVCDNILVIFIGYSAVWLWVWFYVSAQGASQQTPAPYDRLQPWQLRPLMRARPAEPLGVGPRLAPVMLVRIAAKPAFGIGRSTPSFFFCSFPRPPPSSRAQPIATSLIHSLPTTCIVSSFRRTLLQRPVPSFEMHVECIECGLRKVGNEKRNSRKKN